MKFKLDENFGERTVALFVEGVHDVSTVREEDLSGCSDPDLFGTCLRESRCLVTLDIDFADVTRFPPGASTGVVVIRVPRNPSLVLLEALVRDLLAALTTHSVSGRLWIVETGRIRVHADSEEDQ